MLTAYGDDSVEVSCVAAPVVRSTRNSCSLLAGNAAVTSTLVPPASRAMPRGVPRPQASVATVDLVLVSTRTMRSASVTSAVPPPLSTTKPFGALRPCGERASTRTRWCG